MKVSITDIATEEEATLTKRFGPIPEDPDTPITFEEWANAKVRSWLQAQHKVGHDELVQDKLNADQGVTPEFQAQRKKDVAPGDKAESLVSRAKAARDDAKQAASG